MSGVVDEDLSGGSDAAEAGGQVDPVTQHGVVEAFFGAHAACHDGTCGDADSYFEGELGLAVQLVAGLSHGEGAADGVLGIIFRRFGCPEEDHDHVTDKFVDCAPVSIGDFSEGRHVVIEKLDDVMSGQLFAEGGEAANVAEEHRDLLLDAAEIVAVVDQALSDGRVSDGAENGAIAFFEGEVGGHFIEGTGQEA